MKEKYLKNSIISFLLITSTILMPFSFIPKKAKAASVNDILGGIGPVIGQLPLCKSIGGIKELFSQGKDLEAEALANLSPKTAKEATFDDDTLTGKVSGAVNKNDAVAVNDENLVKSNNEIKKSTTGTEKSVAKLSNNDTCLKSIGRVIIKMLLQKITIDTVKWINGGFDSEGPLFVQDYGAYFKDILKDEILGFADEINDPVLYPFGEAFIKAQVTSYNRKFANNARYSLNEMIKATNPQSEFTAKTFSKDFSKGGWSAWNALTQNPANNPLGFALMASNELGKRVEENTSLVKGSLQMSGGYLAVEKCRNPADVTKDEDRQAKNKVEGKRRCTGGWYIVTPGQMVADAATKVVNYPESNLLKAEDLNDAVAAILDALLGKFSSSLMEGGFASLSGDGSPPEFTQGEDGSFVINGENTSSSSNSNFAGQDYSSFVIASSSFLSQNPNFNIREDLSQALIDEQRIYQGKILEQNKELMSKIDRTKENDPTMQFSGYYGLLPTIMQLDYCIPGPHPGYENDSSNILQAALDAIVPEDTNSLNDRTSEEVVGMVKQGVALIAAGVGLAIGATIFSEIPVLGTAVGAVIGAAIGFIVGVIIDWITGSPDGEELARMYYNAQFKNIVHSTGTKICGETDTGINQGCDGPTEEKIAKGLPALHNKGSFSDAMFTILRRYFDKIKNVYTPERLPAVAEEAVGKYLQLRGYNQIFSNNEKRSVSMIRIITVLKEIKTEIETLNQELKENKIKDINGIIVQEDQQLAQYEENLKPWISSFGRISQEMVTGDDIALVDNTTRQIIDEKNYVYNDLLKGPNGCENSLEYLKGADGKVLGTSDNPEKNYSDGVYIQKTYSAKRPFFDYPILYDYNKFAQGAALPDPYNSGYINHMPSKWPNGDTIALESGRYQTFLLGVVFEDQVSNWCGDNWKTNGNIQNYDKSMLGGGPICLQDLFQLLPMGSGSGNSGEYVNATFEKIIGIY